MLSYAIMLLGYMPPFCLPQHHANEVACFRRAYVYHFCTNNSTCSFCYLTISCSMPSIPLPSPFPPPPPPPKKERKEDNEDKNADNFFSLSPLPFMRRCSTTVSRELILGWNNPWHYQLGIDWSSCRHRKSWLCDQPENSSTISPQLNER